MSVLREWRAEIHRHLSAEYVEYISGTGLKDYRKTPGNLGAVIATRDLDDARTEVVTLSLWTSMEAIKSFAGNDPERARYYPEDDRFLLTRPSSVKHYEAFGELLAPATG